MQVGCAWRLARIYALMPGRQAVFSVGDDLGLEAALDLAELGLDIQAVADMRAAGQDPKLAKELAQKGIPFFPGSTVVSVAGARQVTGVEMTDQNGNNLQRFGCDLLVASAGLSPQIGPLSTAGAQLTFDEHTCFFLPEKMPPRVHAAGRLLGLTDPAAIEASGHVAGLKAVCDVGLDVSLNRAEDELAAYKLALEPFPGYFGVFYRTNRPTKNTLEAGLIETAQKRAKFAAPAELLATTFSKFS